MNYQPLRVWPAIVLLLIMWSARLVPRLASERSMTLFMISFLGPAIGAVCIWVWWVAISRATKSERLWGGIGILLIAAVTLLLVDPSLRGFGVVMSPIPWGMTLFAVAAILCSRLLSPKRVVIVLVAGLVGFGFWDAVRSDGVWGDFRGSRSWRWSPTAEDRFLATLANRETATFAGNSGDESPFLAPEWSEFRGPARDSRVPNVRLAEDWNATPPKQVWKIQLGPAWSSFSVAGEFLFTQEQRGKEDTISCYDTETGKERWSQGFESRFWEPIAGAGPRATPTIHEGRLYALGAAGLLTCLDPATGQVHWQHDLTTDADREPPTWGFSSSPLVHDGKVIVHAGGDENLGLLAYDATSGEFQWSVPAGNHSYSSPQRAMLFGREYVMFVDNNGMSAVDPDAEKVVWTYDDPFEAYRVLQPLQVGASSFLVATGMGNGTRRVEVTQNEDGACEVEEAWHSRGMKPDFNDFIVHKGHVYGFDSDIFACIDAETGEKAWKKGRYGHGQVLLLPDSDQLLVLTEKGKLKLVRANPEQFEEVGSFDAIEGKTWNHPVLVGKKLFVRNAEWAVRIDLPLASDTAGESAVDAAEDSNEEEATN